MKRGLEAPLILMVSVITAGATATFIHDAKQGSPDALIRWASQGLHTVSTWFRTATNKDTPPKNAVPVIAHGESRNPNVALQSVQITPTGSQRAQIVSNSKWTREDVNRLQSVLSDLLTNVKPEEWSQLIQSFGDSNPSQAGAQIAKVLNRHLTRDDTLWLTSRLQGPQSFGTTDVQLLERVFCEVRDSLTPDEQTMVESEVNAFGSSAKTGLPVQ